MQIHERFSHRRVTKILALILITLLIFIIFSPISVRADWHATLSRAMSPTAPSGGIYIGVSTTFTYTLTNTGGSSCDISSFELTFDWQTTPAYQLCPSTVSISPGGSQTFTKTFTVPTISIGQHTAESIITGQAVGDWWASDKTWTSNFEVVEIPDLEVACSVNPTTGQAPLSVSFSSTVSGGLTPYTYSWTFGDGGTSTSAYPSHTYNSAGTYTATLTVQDSSPTKKTESVSKTITVTTPPLTVSISSGASGYAPCTITFSSTVSGGTSPYLYTWDFDDGGTSTLVSPSHSFSTAGTFTVSLTVQDSSSPTNTKTATKTVTVLAHSLSVSISKTPSSGAYPVSISFTSLVSGGSTPYIYSWEFGDGGTSSLSSPTHTYTTAGTFTVTLTVQDSSSTPTTKSATTTVSVTVPIDNDDDDGGSRFVGEPNWALILTIIGIVVGAIVVVGIAIYMARKPPQHPSNLQQPPPQQD